MKVRFYKKNDRWYADVPDHTEEENEMVSGSDTLLDILSKDNSEISLNISTTPSCHSRHAIATLFMLKHDDFGAVYQIVSHNDELEGRTLWICNVTHDVLGEHPSYIFIY